jgi:hypothetical protein
MQTYGRKNTAYNWVVQTINGEHSTAIICSERPGHSGITTTRDGQMSPSTKDRSW